MTILTSMRNAAARAPGPLGEAGTVAPVVRFLLEHLQADGGFAGRSPASDLYYTVFALMALEALGDAAPASTADYLRTFGDGGGLDLVHLASLARCRALLASADADDPPCQRMLGRLRDHRCPDGGYTHIPGAAAPSAYGGFLALGAMQDLGCDAAEGEGLGGSIRRLRSADGAYANAPGLPVGSTSATAAAVVTLRALGEPVDPAVGLWLLSQRRQGGFLAAPAAPAPDLLSTATALHALNALETPPDLGDQACLDFVESLWTGRGFRGHWADDASDCEYTFYGLLALGHLTD